MDMETVFAQALHIIEPWFIKSLDFNLDNNKLNVYVDFRRGTKFTVVDDEAGINMHQTAYDTVQKTWRHLNFFEHECNLHVRVPRLMTEDGKIRVVTPPWSGVMSGFTMLFEAYVLALIKKMPVKSASEILKISDYKVWEIAKKYVTASRKEEDFSEVEAIGVDETSQKKHHNYISLFVDLSTRRTIYVEKGKSNKVIKGFKDDLIEHNGQPEQIKDVSCDMSPAFIKGIKENLPNARITYDKFHVVKLLSVAVDKVRRKEVTEKPLLKKSRYVFLKNEENLNEKQKTKLEELSMPELNLDTVRAYQYKKNFMEIYNAETEEEFVLLLTKWYEWAIKSDLEPIVSVAETIYKHWDGIVEWKRSQINNGILEGLNSVVQAAKNKARGFRNFEYFRTIVYLITGKLDFSCINKYCTPT